MRFANPLGLFERPAIASETAMESSSRIDVILAAFNTLMNIGLLLVNMSVRSTLALATALSVLLPAKLKA